MKKFLLILALVFPMIASAQKFGHINSNEVFYQMPELTNVEDSITKLQNRYRTELQTYYEEYQKKIEDYQKNSSTMTDMGREMAEKDIQQIQERIEMFQQQAAQEVQQKQQDLLAPIREKLQNAIKAVGEAKGLTYVFDSASLLYVAPSATDITKDVKAKLGLK